MPLDDLRSVPARPLLDRGSLLPGGDERFSSAARDSRDPDVPVCRLHRAPLKYPVHVGRLEDTSKGNRPSFIRAEAPERAAPLVERFCEVLGELGIDVQTGVFGARMEVELVNAGPVTLVLEG